MNPNDFKITGVKMTALKDEPDEAEVAIHNLDATKLANMSSTYLDAFFQVLRCTIEEDEVGTTLHSPHRGMDKEKMIEYFDYLNLNIQEGSLYWNDLKDCLKDSEES